jgi:hypothetical protein
MRPAGWAPADRGPWIALFSGAAYLSRAPWIALFSGAAYISARAHGRGLSRPGPFTDRLPGPQISTTKGTGGDVIILEEAAYIDSNFFYVSPLPPYAGPLATTS